MFKLGKPRATISTPAPSDAEIEQLFQSRLESESWPRSGNNMVAHDKRFSPFYGHDKILREPRRKVLLLSDDGRIVLGIHNENNDQVWAQSGRGKDGKSDGYHDSWSVQDIVVGEIPGFIEYLETLLTEEDGTCGHSPRISRDSCPGIPARLCFFSQWSDPDRGVRDDIYYVDTENLCEECYRKAVPRGFNVWSTSYFDRYNNKLDQDYRRYFTECHKKGEYPSTHDVKSGSFLRRYWPRCYSAKLRKPAFDITSKEGYPKVPGGTVVHECWRWLVWNRAPFYIDQLCVFPPYTAYDDAQKKQEENQRISKLNASAYIGAAHGILGIPPGGRGEWTMVELRILGKRAVRLPRDFGDAAALKQFGPGYIVHGDTYWEPPPIRYSGRLKRDPGYTELALPQTVESQSRAPSERLPEEQKVLDELIVQIGKPLGPTLEEAQRVRQFPNRNYAETVRKYEDLLAHLRERMSETTAPVDKTPHPTTTLLTSKPDPLIDALIDMIETLSLSSDSKTTIPTNTTEQRQEPVVFYRRFAGKPRVPRERDPNDVPRGSGRLDRLYCHDASPYVYRGPFRIVEDVAEVGEWLVESDRLMTKQRSEGRGKVEEWLVSVGLLDGQPEQQRSEKGKEKEILEGIVDRFASLRL